MEYLMGEQFDRAKSMKHLDKSAGKCCRGVGHKISAQTWKLERVVRCEALQDSVEHGNCTPGHGRPFKIYEPKERDILPPLFRDRVWQRSMCDAGVYEDMTRGLIYDCGACLKGKGTEFAVLRMVAALERFYRHYGDNRGVMRHLDVRKFFPSTYHADTKAILAEHVTEPEFLPHLYAIIDSFPDKRSAEEIAADPRGPRGTGLGSPISQLVQLAVLEDIDKAVSALPGVFAYQRYMDDITILTRTKEAADEAAALVVKMLARRGLSCTDKGGNNRLDKGFFYLKKKFILTETGKVLILPDKAKFYRERRALRDMKRRLDAGKITMKDVENHYESWVSGLMICNCGRRLKDMDAYYAALFRKRPCYKCKKKGRRKNMKYKTKEEAMLDQVSERLAQQKADIDYVAMMADIEIPIEEVNNNEQPEV